MHRSGFVVLLLLFSVTAWSGQQTVEQERQVTLSVSGMTCSVCPITVRKALSRVPGVLDAVVDYDSKTARVRFDPARASVQLLQDATGQAGYPSRPVTQ